MCFSEIKDYSLAKYQLQKYWFRRKTMHCEWKSATCQTLWQIWDQSNRRSRRSSLKLKEPNSPRIFLSPQVTRGSTLISYATSLERGNELASTLFFPISASETGRDGFGGCLGCVICLRFELFASRQRSRILSPEWIIKVSPQGTKTGLSLWLHICTLRFLSARQAITSDVIRKKQ
jgi:hypothetical protein